MADGMVDGQAVDIALLRIAVASSVRTLPLAGRVDLDAWKVEVHVAGDRAFLCASKSQEGTRCTSDPNLDDLALSLVEGDHYRIFALSSSSDLRITRRRSPTGGLGDEESLPIQSAEVGDHHLGSTTTEDLDGLQVHTGAGGTGIVGPG